MLLKQYLKEHHKHLKPVNPKKSETKVPKDTKCPDCRAPSKYLYFNDGKKRSQIKCKVCDCLFNLHRRLIRKTKFWCPHCNHALYLWKHRRDCSIYKCDNDQCSVFTNNFKKLNRLEKALRKTKSSQFKLRYQYREYHFTNEQLQHSAPDQSNFIFNIRNSMNTLCLALTFHISLGISARKTAFILQNVFQLQASYQTVLNYTLYAAPYCHRFNLEFKGHVESTQAGDETYIKVAGKHAYTFFFITPTRRKITSYHIDDSRDTLPATIAMTEAIRTAPDNQSPTFITDGNPSYPSGIHFLNESRNDNNKISHKQVIGLQNLDSESTEFRPLKQLIERLNRTYKFHTQAANGFNNTKGAISLTTLFVTYYNFFRPHASLDYESPIPRKDLLSIPTLQGKWAQVLNTAFSLN
ncbi:MAG: DDE-type integrase/transposase/recombinase [Deltaproteobacteria bacterium]|nr:DDE-type integrase/transposase/recombinase [Deltaproteobacteria bacterium]